MVDKKYCKRLYKELRADIPDLNSATFSEHWFFRAKQLKDAGCWWHYKKLLDIAKRYRQGEFKPFEVY